MRKIPLSPAEIEAGDFSSLTKQKYHYAWNRFERMKSIRDKARELREKLRQNADLPIQQLADLLGISKKSVTNIACKHKIILYGNGRRGTIPASKARIEGKLKEYREAQKAKKIKSIAEKAEALKIKRQVAKKAKVAQVVRKDKIIKSATSNAPKIEKETPVCMVKDFTGQKQHQLGYMRMSFYMPFDATEEQVKAERQRRLEKYKRSAA